MSEPIVLDAGALIALERNDRVVWAALKLAALESTDVRVPTTVLAQVWRRRPTQARLAAALRYVILASFDAVAREVGELCGLSKTTNICDAHVAIVAARHAGVLYTSDPEDMHRLLSKLRATETVIVRC